MNWKRLLVGTWNWKRPFYSAGFLYSFFFLFAFGCADRVIFVPPPATYDATMAGLKQVPSSKGDSISVVYLPASKGKPTLLMSHGNAEDLMGTLAISQNWVSEGFGIMAYDYPGYGHSSGTPSEPGANAAIEAAWKHLTETHHVPADQIVLVGRSVGSGPTTWLASRTEPAGVVLIAPFVSAFRVMTRVPLFPFDRFPNIAHVKHLKQPLLVIHGERDTIIKPWHGRALYDAHPGPDKKFVPIPDADHNDLFDMSSDQIEKEVSKFAERVTHQH